MMRKLARKKWICALLMLLSLLLAACAQVEDVEDHTEVLTPWEEEAQSGDAPETQGLKQFALAYRQGKSLDPMTCSDGEQFQVATLLYEPLVQLDETFLPQPLLCSEWEISEDCMTYTLTLREGVQFSDGTPLEAKDVVTCLRQAVESPRYGSRLGNVRQISHSRGKVVIHLLQPNSSFLALLDIPIRKTNPENALVPLGTGPYCYADDGDRACLKANPDWWQGKTLPLARIELVNAKDSDTAMHLFKAREIQLYTTDLTGTAALTGKLDVVDVPTTVMQFIGINTKKEALQNTALRQALSQGVPRQTVVDGYLSGHGAAAQFPISPAADEYPMRLEQGYSYDGYRQAVAAVIEEPVELTMLVNSDNTLRVSIANYVAGMLSTDNLTVTLRALPWAEYLQALESGAFDLYYGEVQLTADWNAAPLMGTGGSLNYGGWSDPTGDALLATHASHKGADRAVLYRYFQMNAPMIPVCFKNESVLTHSGTVENITPAAGDIFRNLPDWKIDLAE